MSSRKYSWVVTPDSQAGLQGARRVPDPVEGCIWIPLRNRLRQIVAYTLIDEQDAALSWTAWHRRADGYAAGTLRRTHPYQGTNNRKTQLLHRVILQAPHGVEVDHINRNRLDNRRCNLRFATSGEQARNVSLNSRNTTGYKGVSFLPGARRWLASVVFDGATYRLGLFKSPEAAAFAYDFAARALHGQFAAVNFKLADRTIAALDEFRHYLLSNKGKERGIATA